MKHWKPLALLALLSATLTEAITGSTPIVGFIQPVTFILFVTLGYGVPVLILRDMSVRKQWGLLQLFMLGIGYGVYNEGLFARTIFFPFHSPIESFNMYGLIGDIRIPWVLAIGIWHALFAVVCPVIIVHCMYRPHAKEPWLSKTTTWVLGVLCVGVGVLRFMQADDFGAPGQTSHLVAMFVLWLLLWIGASRLSHAPHISIEEPTPTFSWKLLGFGALLLIGFFIFPAFALAGLQAPFWAFVAYYAALLWVFGRKVLSTKSATLEECLLVALGAEIALGFFSLLIAISTMQIPQIVFTMLITTAFIIWVYRLKRLARGYRATV